MKGNYEFRVKSKKVIEEKSRKRSVRYQSN